MPEPETGGRRMQPRPVSPSLFDSLTDDDLRSLMAFLSPVSFPYGATLFRQRAMSDGCYLIREGEVALCTRLPSLEEVMTEIAGPGDIVGESVLVSEAPRAQTATARGDVAALFVEGKNVAILRSLVNPLHAKVLYPF